MWVVGTLLLGCGHATASGSAGESAAPIGSEAGEIAEIGKSAPDFELTDLEGNPVRLADHRGKTVVLEWMNIDCPVWRGRMEELAATHGRFVSDGSGDVVWLNVDSTYYISPEKLREFATANGVTRTMLVDPTGRVGRMYDARTTPHMFVIDDKGVLIYDGALDNQKSRGADDPFVNHVSAALDATLAGGTVSEPKTLPYGCSVKYKK